MHRMLKHPTAELVTERLASMRDDLRFVDTERAVAIVFTQWPRNVQIEEVLAKVAVLNAMYSTNIYGLHTVANHIVTANIDERLRCGDLRIVDEIAVTTYTSNKTRVNLSFASKYCSWHQPEHFQIYDRFVIDALCAYQSRDSFAAFQRQDLRQYPTFIRVIDTFLAHYELTMFTRKQLDQFLWMEGKRLASASK